MAGSLAAGRAAGVPFWCSWFSTPYQVVRVGVGHAQDMSPASHLEWGPPARARSVVGFP